MASRAWPSEYVPARLKEMVTAGNCPWCAIASASLSVWNRVKALRGTGVWRAAAPPAELPPPPPPPDVPPEEPAELVDDAGREVPLTDVFALEAMPAELLALDSTVEVAPALAAADS